MRGGNYRLRAPIVIAPADSGTQAGPVRYAAYPGEKPVFSGGRVIRGWRRLAKGLGSVRIPEIAAPGRLAHLAPVAAWQKSRPTWWTMSSFYARRARDQGIAGSRCESVVQVQRFDSAMRLSVSSDGSIVYRLGKPGRMASSQS